MLGNTAFQKNYNLIVNATGTIHVCKYRQQYQSGPVWTGFEHVFNREKYDSMKQDTIYLAKQHRSQCCGKCGEQTLPLSYEYGPPDRFWTGLDRFESTDCNSKFRTKAKTVTISCVLDIKEIWSSTAIVLDTAETLSQLWVDTIAAWTGLDRFGPVATIRNQTSYWTVIVYINTGFSGHFGR